MEDPKKQIFVRAPSGDDVDVTPAVSAFIKSLEVAGIALGYVATYLMEQDWFMDWVESHPVVNGESDADSI